MKIGIVVHSKTGNTLGVAQEIKDRLLTAGHEAKVLQLTVYGDDMVTPDKVKLKDIPDISGYDALILGAPVRGFSLSPVMHAYIGTLGMLSGKKIALFVTHSFPLPSMGGKQAISQAVKLCEAHGAKVLDTGIISRMNFKSKEITAALVEKFGKLF